MLDQAVALAHRNDASVTLLDVQESIPARSRRPRLSDGSVVDLDSVILESRVEEMGRIADGHPEVELDAVTTASPVFVEVIERVIREGFDLVVVPDDLADDASGATIGHLFRKCPVPVMLLRAEASPDVAVAVGPFHDESRSMLDETLMEMASSLASIRGGRLHVIHAWRLVGENLLRSSARRGDAAAMVDELVAETGRQAVDDVRRPGACRGCHPGPGLP